MMELREQSVFVTGPLTIETVPGLAEGMSDFLSRGAQEVNLSGVTEVDSSAVALLLEWQRQAKARNTVLKCTGLPAALKNLADLYGVVDLVSAA